MPLSELGHGITNRMQLHVDLKEPSPNIVNIILEKLNGALKGRGGVEAIDKVGDTVTMKLHYPRSSGASLVEALAELQFLDGINDVRLES